VIIVYTFHFNTHNLADNIAKDHVHSEATFRCERFIPCQRKTNKLFACYGKLAKFFPTQGRTCQFLLAKER